MALDLDPILAALNERSTDFRFAALQKIRKDRRPLQRRPSTHPFPFTTTEQWAHHVGGRDELQFNVAEDSGRLRWGLAISLQPSHSLPDITVMYPKLRKFSRALEIHGPHLHNRGFTMWDWKEHTPFEGRSSDRPPGPVDADLYQSGVFVVLGKHAPPESFDPSRVLRDFDALLPIYEYVEFGSEADPPALCDPRPFVFKPDPQTDATHPPPVTVTTRVPGETVVSYQHRKLQDALKQNLIEEGAEVGTEHPDGNGRYIDLVARRDGELEFYEIKSGLTPRLCIREALGQLLEYGYWGDAARPTRLFVAGEQPVDTEAQAYLGTLNEAFGLSIGYLQVDLPND